MTPQYGTPEYYDYLDRSASIEWHGMAQKAREEEQRKQEQRQQKRQTRSSSGCFWILFVPPAVFLLSRL